MQRRLFTILLSSLLSSLLLSAPAAQAQNIIKLSTTTSTENSGLLKVLLPAFEARTGMKVHVISVGTGKALELARNGDVDVTLVHARQLEDAFMREGWGVDRRDVMYNDFIVVGPATDPAAIKGGKDVIAAFRKIAASGARFISRGDNSGTDVMEKAYWQGAAAKPAGASYVSAGLGMGEVLNMAAEMRAYTLTDRATYGAYRARTGLAVLVEGDQRMFNPYGIIAVNPARHQGVNYRGARALIEWITSGEGQAHIAAFRPQGEQLFFPAAAR
ncbi:substrate-binding domain-containing protein [Massilia sp. H6]|uniref:substrate-binding domain-containing protein n=1 Tax=Massilia sp. H6 TaxID=2970464 RepID=UPI0021679732|nr:substrate-binding domain-containing protein [Massilia sp. H6]UVW28113.1 substrate-binding domain-containing protein [Massilia sp. H6]